MFDRFFGAIVQFAPLSEESINALAAHLRQVEYPKGHVLVEPDTTCHYLYFVERGLTRTFYYKDGKDVTDWISAENSFAVSLISFITAKPDRRGIALLEPSVFNAIHRNDLEMLCAKHHDIERMVRHLVNSGLVQLQQKFDDQHFATALERYQNLTVNHPTYLRRVPLGMIASYLGITQETLSRIRASLIF